MPTTLTVPTFAPSILDRLESAGCTYRELPNMAAVTFRHTDGGLAPTVQFANTGDGLVYRINGVEHDYPGDDADVRDALFSYMVAAGSL